ncbi:MAG: GIN domain-containing protein [Pseudonocardiaceae bacterium]
MPAAVPQWGLILVSLLLLAACQTSPGADGASVVESTDVDGMGGGHVVVGGHPISEPVTGSGRLTHRKLDLTEVTNLAVGAGFVVRVRIGESAQATVWLDDNLTDLVDATVTGNRLHLGLKPQRHVRNATLSAEVTVRDLDQLTTSGAGHVTLATDFAGDALGIEAGGASHVTGRLEVAELAVSASGTSTFALSGHVGHLDLEASDASGLQLSRLAVQHLDGVLFGASCATVAVSDTLAARTSGASALRYSGAPRITREQSTGASSIALEGSHGDRCGA